MLPIIWNSALQKWEVFDQNQKVLWRGEKYADAAQFVEDYTKQQAILNGLGEK